MSSKIGVVERLCCVRPWVPVVMYVPVVGVLGYVGGMALGWGLALGYGVLGLWLWTLVEYVVHRWVFHGRARSAWGRRVLYLAHGMHHEQPSDPLRVVMPPPTSLVLGGLFYGGLVWAFGAMQGGCIFGGLVAGYLSYDLLHYAIHHRALHRVPGGAWLKRYHLRHHFRDDSAGFGVTSPLWDRLLGTAPRRRDGGRQGADAT